MSSSERSPKRQRRSLSPSSPLYNLSSQENPTKPTARLPQTPQSPSRMSPKPHGSPDAFSQTFPTPPNTAGLSTHMPNASVTSSDMTQGSANMSQDTPVSMAMSRDGDRETQTNENDDANMTDARDHNRSDHEREEAVKGKAAVPSQVASGVFPLLCEKSHSMSAPHPSWDLVSLYSLGRISASVARKDPVTGEKINKLRKSYEGKVKNQGLPGRNKPTDVPGELMGFMEWPEEGWYDQRIHGRELENALGGPMMSKLDRALAMQPGRLPNSEHEKWKGVLGLEDTTAAKTPSMAPTKNAAQTAMQRTQMTSMRASAPASPRGSSVRPDRANKKRRYDDASFEGYADGYHEDDGYSTGGMEDRRNSASRKRRREYSSHDFDGPNNHFGSSGMVGVKSS